MRTLIGVGTPRGLQGRVAALMATLYALIRFLRARSATILSCDPVKMPIDAHSMEVTILSRTATCTTG
jgi:hypothetical protein